MNERAESVLGRECVESVYDTSHLGRLFARC